jgi:hypothetical protein
MLRLYLARNNQMYHNEKVEYRTKEQIFEDAKKHLNDFLTTKDKNLLIKFLNETFSQLPTAFIKDKENIDDNYFNLPLDEDNKTTINIINISSNSNNGNNSNNASNSNTTFIGENGTSNNVFSTNQDNKDNKDNIPKKTEKQSVENSSEKFDMMLKGINDISKENLQYLMIKGLDKLDKDQLQFVLNYGNILMKNK